MADELFGALSGYRQSQQDKLDWAGQASTNRILANQAAASDESMAADRAVQTLARQAAPPPGSAPGQASQSGQPAPQDMSSKLEQIAAQKLDTANQLSQLGHVNKASALFKEGSELAEKAAHVREQSTLSDAKKLDMGEKINSIILDAAATATDQASFDRALAETSQRIAQVTGRPPQPTGFEGRQWSPQLMQEIQGQALGVKDKLIQDRETRNAEMNRKNQASEIARRAVENQLTRVDTKLKQQRLDDLTKAGGSGPAPTPKEAKLAAEALQAKFQDMDKNLAAVKADTLARAAKQLLMQNRGLLPEQALNQAISNAEQAGEFKNYATGTKGGGSALAQNMNENVYVAINEAATSLENIMTLPGTATSGITQGRNTSGLMSAPLGVFANEITGETAQRYNQEMQTVGFNIATIIRGGRITPTGQVQYFNEKLAIKEGDKGYTALTKLAQARQDVEKAAEVKIASPSIPAEQKKILEKNLETIRRAIPFTVKDINEDSIRKHPTQTLGDLAKASGVIKDGGLKEAVESHGQAYEPDKYDYRIENGAVQRKPKGG